MAKQFNNNTKTLSVCHDSIYRNLVTLYYFRDLVRKRGLEDMFYLDSTATSTKEISNGIHHGTRKKLRQTGISCQGHHVKQTIHQDYKTYDYLIDMDDWNIRNVNRITDGDPDHKIYKFMGFIGDDRDVADPWYIGDFETTRQDITAGCSVLLELIGRTR